MINFKKIVSINTAVQVAGLGAGSVAANYVTNKVAPKIFKTESSAKFAPALPILAGVILSGTKAGGILSHVGNGMIANAAGKVIAGLVDADGTIGLGGDVMLAGGPMLSGSGDSDYSSDSYDFTASAAGEMDY